MLTICLVAKYLLVAAVITWIREAKQWKKPKSNLLFHCHTLDSYSTLHFI